MVSDGSRDGTARAAAIDDARVRVIALPHNVGKAMAINAAMREAAASRPALIGVTEDPIVSSDVIGCRQSLLFDCQATSRAGKRLLKALAWYETLGHACRVLDVVRTYARLGGGERT